MTSFSLSSPSSEDYLCLVSLWGHEHPRSRLPTERSALSCCALLMVLAFFFFFLKDCVLFRDLWLGDRHAFIQLKAGEDGIRWLENLATCSVSWALQKSMSARDCGFLHSCVFSFPAVAKRGFPPWIWLNVISILCGHPEYL